MENVKHGVQTMGSCKSLIMCSYSKSKVWIYVYCAYIDFALVVIDIIDFIFIINDSTLINFHQNFLCCMVKLTWALVFSILLLALFAHHVLWMVRWRFLILFTSIMMLRFAVWISFSEVVNVMSVTHSEFVVEHPLLMFVFWSLQVNFAFSS